MPEKFTIPVVDITGKIVYQDEIKEHGYPTRLNIEQIPGGIYLLKINSENKTTTRKLVIQK